MSKPKYKETGAQLTGLGTGGLALYFISDIVNSLSHGMHVGDALELHHAIILAALTIWGAVYRFGVKWLEAHDVTAQLAPTHSRLPSSHVAPPTVGGGRPTETAIEVKRQLAEQDDA